MLNRLSNWLHSSSWVILTCLIIFILLTCEHCDCQLRYILPFYVEMWLWTWGCLIPSTGESSCSLFKDVFGVYRPSSESHAADISKDICHINHQNHHMSWWLNYMLNGEISYNSVKFPTNHTIFWLRWVFVQRVSFQDANASLQSWGALRPQCWETANHGQEDHGYGHP